MSNLLNAATFGRDARAYLAARPTYPAALFDWLGAAVPGHSLAWDVGCGSGQATAALAERFTQVIANDISAEALALAPKLANVMWRHGAAEDIALDPSSVDLGVAASAFHWLDLDRFFPLLKRVLRPRGVFVAIAYGSSQFEPALNEAVLDAFKPLQPYWSDGNRALWRGYADLPFPLDALVVPPFSIELDWTLERYLQYASTWSACRRYVDTMPQHKCADPIDHARRRLAPIWGSGTRHISMPLTIKAGRNDAR